MSDSARERFHACFRMLTGNEPFPWQEALFEELLVGTIRSSGDIPTGLGKTAIMTIWLLALAERARNGSAADFPRRLVYVVNRRTVVDQATREAERMRARLAEPELDGVRRDLRSLGIQRVRGLTHLDNPLAISTLRGQFADNAEWRADPARPAIVVGTIDMIGSRLLFSGYGRGFKARPLHAAFVGQHTLLVHDETHLEPAFQSLAEAVELEQQKNGEGVDAFGRLRLLALTATSRAEQTAGGAFRLTEKDLRHDVVRSRVYAKKGLAFHSGEQKIADKIGSIALGHRDSGQAILVFARTIEDVDKVTRRLPEGSYVTLTGTMRGRERDRLRENPIFARFDPRSELSSERLPAHTVYLVCTSAGEVGVDISSDHMVCDLTPFDSMAQRFGRVNRYGAGCAQIDVVCPGAVPDEVSSTKAESDEEDKKLDPFDIACQRTRDLLCKLPFASDPALAARRDASPMALGDLPVHDRLEAFTPPPTIFPLTDVLLDAWTLTTIRQDLPGRPPVADWLHGRAEQWDPPETYVGWRREVEIVTGALLDRHPPEDVLDEYPVKPHELLRDRSDRVLKHLVGLSEKTPQAPIWLVMPSGNARPMKLADMVEQITDEVARAGNKRRHPLEGCCVLLSPSSGGLHFATGRFTADAVYDSSRQADYDVADEWGGTVGALRQRIWGEERPTRKMRLVRTIRLEESNIDSGDGETSQEEPAVERVWRWYVAPESADDEGSRTAVREQTLEFHLGAAEHFARELVDRIGLREPEASAVVWAARCHDLGKQRSLWQRSIGNRDPSRVLAKSSGHGFFDTSYRHELGSLFDMDDLPGAASFSDDAKDLARHLVAAHHGRARPHFPVDEILDPSHTQAETIQVAQEVPRRFGRLQRRYGRWGLAYLESLVRAADALASQLDQSTKEQST